ncbi:MAG: hypothetical protein HY973_03670 [Candidatus Kerfeldbacteria bacterium]|nr:hypothetical protein [Candidatus Kerfeldbacteria bacterium]
MNRYLWLVITIFVIAASYGMYRLIFYNPTEQITQAKLDLSRSQTNTDTAAKPDLPFQGPQLPPANPNQINQPTALMPSAQPQLPGPRLDSLPNAHPPQTQPNLPQQPPTPNPGALTGKWQNNTAAQYTMEFKADNTVTEYTNGKPTGSGTWKFEDAKNQSAGPKTQLLKVIVNNETRSYQILNLSATNLSYITNAKEGIQSFNRLP